MIEKRCAYCGDQLDECYVIINSEYLCCYCDANLTTEAEEQLAEDIAEFNQQRLNDVRDFLARRDGHQS